MEETGVHTRQIPNENLARSHLVEVAHINTIPRKALRIKDCRARMNEYTSIFLVEIFDSLGFWVEFYGS